MKEKPEEKKRVVSSILAAFAALCGFVAFIVTAGPGVYDRFGPRLAPDQFIDMELRAGTDAFTIFHRTREDYQRPLITGEYQSILIIYNRTKQSIRVDGLSFRMDFVKLHDLPHDEYDYYSIYEGGAEWEYESIFAKLSCKDLREDRPILMQIDDKRIGDSGFDVPAETTAFFYVYTEFDDDCAAQSVLSGAVEITALANVISLNGLKKLEARSPLSYEYGLTYPPPSFDWHGQNYDESPIPELARHSAAYLTSNAEFYQKCIETGGDECASYLELKNERYPKQTTSVIYPQISE